MKRAFRSVVAGTLVFALGVACDDERNVIVDGFPEPPPPTSEAALVDALEDAYHTRSLSRFEPLFHADFWYSESTSGAPVAICRDQWICLHRRLFEPQSIPPGEAPPPPELWLQAITIAATLETAFDERSEYYQSATNPDGLDPVRWRATAADAVVSILFETQGEMDYQIMRRARLVVAEDRSKAAGEVGKYRFYRIDVTGVPVLDVQDEQKSWSAVLHFYGGACAACPPPAAVDP